jgi:hypothetical protein
VVSIIGTDRLKGGYGVAKVAHERATLSGPIPARVLRAAQFHEFVEQLVQWGTQGEVSYVPKMRTQLVAARTVAEALADLAADPESAPGPTLEVAGPREESLVEMAKLLVARRGNSLRVEAVSDPVDGDATSPASCCRAHTRGAAARPSRSGWSRSVAELDFSIEGGSGRTLAPVWTPSIASKRERTRASHRLPERTRTRSVGAPGDRRRLSPGRRPTRASRFIANRARCTSEAVLLGHRYH